MKRTVILILIFLLFAVKAPPVLAAPADIYERVDADALLRALPEETAKYLRSAGISPDMEAVSGLEALFRGLAEDLQAELTGPQKTLWALLAAVLLTRLLLSLAPQALNDAAGLCGTLCTAVLLFPPILELFRQTADTTQVLGGFLAAAVPVYTGLILLSGAAAAGSTYGALTLAAANGITALSGQVFLPLLRVFLALTTVSAATAHSLERFTDKLYRCLKWVLTLAVSLFAGILSLQTLLSAQADKVTGKAVRMVASSAIPIVGGAFGDALSVLSAGVGTVKSGTGAFGILAALMILLPLGVKICIWIFTCEAVGLAAELLSLRGVGTLVNGCSTVLKMLLALLFSAGMAAVITAAVLLCVRGAYG